MKPFTYQKAGSRSDAMAAANAQSQYIAGGTNLLDLMKKHIDQPDVLVDITSAVSAEITQTDAGMRIGAMVRNAVVANDPGILRDYPLVSKAILKGASPQIRNMASTGGNLLQRTRCPYFYDTTLPCNKRKPGSGCGALNGDNRTAAILGYSEACVAVHPSDLCVALAALDAEVEILTQDHKVQRIPFANFHRLPGDSPHVDNTLPGQALITAVLIPENPYNINNSYLKLRDRDSYAFALVSVAAALELKDGRIASARLASGGVAHKPWRWTGAEEFLNGKTPTVEIFEQAAELAANETQPLMHNSYKVPLLKGAIVTALQQCLNK